MSTLSASLLRLKLLDALRSGDNSKIDGVMSDLTKTPSTTHNRDFILLKETVLHYAVQVAPLSTITHLVSDSEKYSIDVNAQDPDGNTPLHLAAQASRGDVVRFLLSLPSINDTILNLNKQQPVEVSKDPAISQLMQFERAKFVEKASMSLRQHFQNRDYKQLEELLVHNQRSAELLDINGADPDTGNTVLHEFIRKDDYEMCEWILNHGGDPFKRDKRGKLPIDLCTKNERLKKLLKNASRNSNLMDPVINTNSAMRAGAPTYKGYLRKWTNFASGYKLRYFILDANGMLSYYSDQDDTGNAVRGSLNLSTAYLHLDSSEKLKFEIIGKNGIRWHLKANHPIESNRWVWTLQNAITVAKDRRRAEAQASGHGSASVGATIGAAVGTAAASNSHMESRTSMDAPEEKRRFFRRRHRRNTSQGSVNSSEDESSIRSKRIPSSPTSPSMSQIQEGKSLPNQAHPNTESNHPLNSTFDHSTTTTDIGSYSSGGEDYDYDMEDYESEDISEDEGKSIETVKNEVSTLKAQLEIGIFSLLDLFKKIEADSSVDQTHAEAYKVASVTLHTVHESFEKFKRLVDTHQAWVERKLDRQLEVNKLWENSIRQLEEEIRKREQKLAEYDGKKKQLKKYLGNENKEAEVVFDDSDDDDFFDANDFEEEEEEAEAEAEAEEKENEREKEREEVNGNIDTPQVCIPGTPIGKTEKIEEESVANNASTESGPTGNVTEDDATTLATTETLTNNHLVEEGIAKKDNKDSSEKDTLQSDNDKSKSLKKSDSESSLNTVQEEHLKKLLEEGSFLGYEKPPRTKLAMDVDDRPKVGLWGILKNLIGKDMTKMTLPVSFNEGTSLLQRLAEDIEYCDLLDTAAKSDDSTLRMVYVGAFAASEYASTIDRIAKPFNPLLGETFEYCRPDQKYRLLVEQVSHHPPISACRAESVNWDYFGENSVDSQFKGRSFDFKHLGKMFCVVRPKNGVIDKNGKKVSEELYSWKKVNTSVVGIMLGNPTVDNFGKMEVTNHTTGDVLTLNLKQRGWRASSAYQLAGYVVDSKKQTHWAVGGHWNSKIFAKKVNNGFDDDRKNSLINESSSDNSNNVLSKDPYSGSKFLVWQAAPRPKVPFNLTQFAITLNDINDNLKPWLPPTDTRLRPDQRAMEDGEYDLAAEEKHRVEEKQRSARKRREQSKTPYKPNWFTRKKHPVTGDNYWESNGSYWQKRKNHDLKDCGDIF